MTKCRIGTYEYEQLLSNSTFCLVARGRRLGSYRFLEALAAGCVPVLLSNGWQLPFHEVIDWRRAALWADERLLLQVPELVRSVSPERVLALRQQTQLLWERYFSSVEKIVFTTIEIILERVAAHAGGRRRDTLAWNTAPGALAVLPSYGDAAAHFPFAAHAPAAAAPRAPPALPPAAPLPPPPPPAAPPPRTPGRAYTAVVYAQAAGPPLHRLIRAISKSEHAEKIVIVWDSDRAAPTHSRLPHSHVNLPIIIIDVASHYPGEGVAARFKPLWAINTAAVFSLDGDTTLGAEELDFAFRVWQHFPDRIVGYPAREHYWDESKNAWGYTSKWTNEYSIVLTGAAVLHRYYLALYEHSLSPLLHKTVAQAQNCEDILMNCLVAHVTRRPPIKVTQRKLYKDTMQQPGARSPWNDPDHFIQRQSCLNTFAAVWGYMPLVRSSTRLDPLLFKDPVSNLRKKYRQIELVGS